MNAYRLVTRPLLILSCLTVVVVFAGASQASDVGNQHTQTYNCWPCGYTGGCTDTEGNQVPYQATICPWL